MTIRIAGRALAAAALLAASAAALAGQVVPVSYDMPNGDGQAHDGTYNYWDAGYTGSGSPTTDGSYLSGGTGKLTDGVISTQPWFIVSNVAGTGEYVGWRDNSPTITFHFGSSVTIDEIKLYVDNSHAGGVTAPSGVFVDGNYFDNPSWVDVTAPQVIDLAHLAFTGDTMTVTLQNPTIWVFMSEAQFFTSSVPEPGSLPLALVGLGGLGALAARRRRA